MQKYLVAFLCLLIPFEVEGKSKPVIASLSTKWKSTSVILEISEFMAEESNELFWEFVETIITFDVHSSSQSPRMLYEASIKAGSMVMGMNPLQINIMKFALGLRMYSPKVEMFYQLSNHVASPDCELFFDIHGKTTCSFEEAQQFLDTAKQENTKPSATFHSDHIYPAHASPSATVILYGDITTQHFKRAHEFAKKLAKDGIARYVFRHFILKRPATKIKLSGYGIELAIKSTEYKASDDSVVKGDADSSVTVDEHDVNIDGFDFATLRRLHSNLSAQLTEFRDHLIDSANEMQPMKVWQLQDLSFQAAARVMATPPEDQLNVLKDISQNFPLRVRSLVKQQVPEEMRKEIKRNQQVFSGFDIEAGESLLFLNGMQIDLSDSDIFELVDLLRTEGNLISGLKKLNVEGPAFQKTMKLNVHPEDKNQHILDFRDSSIVWATDIENDDKYKHWPANVHELLRPAFPGTLRRVRKNMFHLLLVIDPELEDAQYLIESAEIFWGNDLPMRIGFCFLVDDSDEVDGNDNVGVALVRAYNYAIEELDDNEKSFSFLTSMYKSLSDNQNLTVDHIKARLSKKFKSADVEEILGPKSSYDGTRKGMRAFYNRVGLQGGVNVLFNGELLSEHDISSENFEETIGQKLLDGYPTLQEGAYYGYLTNDMNVLDFLMKRDDVVPRFNERILTSDEKFLNLLGKPQTLEALEKIDKLPQLSEHDHTATVAHLLTEVYLSKSDQSKYVRPVTMWIVADVESKDGRKFVYNALKHVKSSSLTRVAIIHNPVDAGAIRSAKFIRAVEAAVATLSHNQAKNFITKIMKEENAAQLVSGEKSLSDFYVGGMNADEFNKVMTSDSNKDLIEIMLQSDWSTSVLGLRKGQQAVVANGKVVGPLNPGETFTSEDFHLLESLIHSTAAEKIQEAVRTINVKPPQMSDLIMKLTAHLSTQSKSKKERRSISPPQEAQSAITLPSSNKETSSYDITAVMDPASEKAQEIIPLIIVLREVLDAKVQIFMNCKEKLSELPVKRFFRYVLEPELNFKVDNSESNGPVAKFIDMPSKSILTLNVHAPASWMVGAVNAVYDLDNIKLEEVAKVVSAEYQLEYLVLEGHARESGSGSPPRGLQFTLGQTNDTVAVDTIVMANLGYFQLKANPGVWYLNLREGRSRDIYQISSHENTELTEDKNLLVLMDSFKSKVVVIKVAKKPDKINVNLIDEDEEPSKEESGGLWNSLASTFTGGSSSEGTIPSGNSSDVINIFSLASGHLYERLMRIMMLSVISKTNTKVKFWVLKNYLSPQYKDFLPYMAKKYGFEYELVQYKWPGWLRAQKEKQRTMWGYKILFLDVLFPLSVDKIIFVDADQIVRADLKELRDLDLEGNPYGYTPFCNDRKEMDGFRFWKGGYWASHLAGRKYHISAIYVVDLKKFRQVAAGDRLRGQYQGLSQDPNSLANLDQDLPNNMIHQVGIKSLPQEWLWCATWCSEASKAKAKTIDLCNNPLTKEPKLKAAVRIAPEWTGYDEEIKALLAEFTEGNETQDKSNDEAKKPGHTEL